jgi:MoxR-like ATPase
VRRCIYYHVPFPERPALHAILLARLRSLLPEGGRLLDDVLDFVTDLRESDVAGHSISPPEVIQWVTFMLKTGADPTQPLKSSFPRAFAGLSSLCKNKGDQASLQDALEAHLGADSHGEALG